MMTLTLEAMQKKSIPFVDPSPDLWYKDQLKKEIEPGHFNDVENICDVDSRK
jgi:hypothetical protein